ncbi:MAG: hypothetical protein ACI87E_002070 [Mariniblastus sp.]|jgi:hypothetical protein
MPYGEVISQNRCNRWEVGIWPEFGHAQTWFSLALFTMLLLGVYLVPYFWVCLFAAIANGVRHAIVGPSPTRTAATAG